jgi:hypothetical protein
MDVDDRRRLGLSGLSCDVEWNGRQKQRAKHDVSHGADYTLHTGCFVLG